MPLLLNGKTRPSTLALTPRDWTNLRDWSNLERGRIAPGSPLEYFRAAEGGWLLRVGFSFGKTDVG